MPKKIKNKNSKKKNKQEGHQARMENRYPPVRQKRQGQKGSKKNICLSQLIKKQQLVQYQKSLPKGIETPIWIKQDA